MDKNEKKIMNNQKTMPDFEKFKELVKKAQTAVDQHPEKIKPGQIWGISGKDYRFVVLSTPEKSITGKDIRVMPITNKTYIATDIDVILPENEVYYSESVVLPFQVTNILYQKLDLYHGEIKDGFIKFLIKTDQKGGLQPLPDYTRLGDNDPNDPIIFEFNESLKAELFGYAQEVFKEADLVQEDKKISIFDTVIFTVREYTKLFKDIVAEPQVSFVHSSIPLYINLSPVGKILKLLLNKNDDISVNITVQNQIPQLIFTSFKLDDNRVISDVRITLTGDKSKGTYHDFGGGKLSSKQIYFIIPDNIANNLTGGFRVSYKLEGKEFELPVKFK
ncbi:MAG: hypothetical protein IT278_12945 [Ignavibacteriaceae bacterium]|nr:hypothetical protein [Ignavibacteriaceae bacterium]